MAAAILSPKLGIKDENDEGGGAVVKVGMEKGAWLRLSASTFGEPAAEMG